MRIALLAQTVRRARLAQFAAAVVLAATLGCAAVGLTPTTSNQPIARQSMFPEYRVFYDALIDYGDWILIEPYGFVFRPRVAWNQWQPFEDGFWAPTDTWGWVWISAEPFGWATYHYGQWFFDRFQGWVWTPGVDWSPGWASWEIAGDYVGWGPLLARGAGRAAGDAGSSGAGTTAMHYAPLSQLGATDLRSHLVTPAQIGPAFAEARPVKNFIQREGVTFNRGPALGLVEQAAGPLVRARIEDLVPVDLGRQIAGAPSRGSGRPRSDAGAAADSAESAAIDAIALTQRAAERAAGEARRLSQLSGAAPARLQVLRPVRSSRPAATPGTPRRPAWRTAADSTR